MSIVNKKAVMVALAVLVLQAGAYYTVSAKEFVPQVRAWGDFPSMVGGWTASADVPVDDRVLTELRPDDYLNRNYVSMAGRRSLNFFIGYFNSRRDGRAPHSPEWCLPGAGWQSLSTKVVSIDLADGKKIPANEYFVEKSEQKALVVYWYYQGQKAIASEVGAQFYAIPDMLLHGRTDTSLIRIITPVAGKDEAAARDAAYEFARNAVPVIEERIR